MKHLKTYKIFESMDDIKSDLEDILTDIKDSNPEDYWYFWVDGEQIEGYEKVDYYEVYISFGSDEPTKRDSFIFNDDVEDDDDDEFQSEYNETEISQSFIDAIKRTINYMEDLEFQYGLFFNTEYSSDPSEDDVSRIDIDDLEVGGYIQENQSIRIQFRK